MLYIISLIFKYICPTSSLFKPPNLMKSTWYDLIFIVVAAAILSAIIYLGYGDILEKYSFIVVLIAYFAGKYVRLVELTSKKDRT